MRSGSLVVAVIAAVLPCIVSHADQPASEMLRLAIHGDIRGLNPGVTRDGDSDTVHHHLYESLVAYDGDLNVRLMLAESLTVSEDMREYEFVLRPNVRFHNGDTLVAEHVVWNWNRMLDPDTGWRCRSWYDGSAPENVAIQTIEAVDSRTVVFRLERPSSIFLDRMANVQCFTAILHPSSIDAAGELHEPIGTGPYRLVEWRRSEFVDLDRHPEYRPRTEPMSGYAGNKAAVTERIRFVIIPDAAIAEAALLSGDIDILPRVPLHLVGELERVPGIKTCSATVLYWNVLLIQSQDPLLSDVRIRRAIAYALNIEQIAAIATFDRASGNPSAVPSISRFYTPKHRLTLPYDPVQARKLLAVAGYEGQVVRLQTNRKYPFMFDESIAVQAMLTAVGMNVRLDVVDWGTQLSNYFEGRFQLSTFGYSGRTHPVLNYATFVGDKSRNPAYQWENQEAMKLLAVAAQSNDTSATTSLYEEVHRMMIEDVPIIGLYNEFEVDAMRTSVSGYAPWAVGRPRLWGVRKIAEWR